MMIDFKSDKFCRLLVTGLYLIIVSEYAAAATNLDRALYSLETAAVPPEQGEQAYEKLTQSTGAVDELGRIYASRLRWYIKHGEGIPEVAIAYAQKALEFPMDFRSEMDVYLKLGIATWHHGINAKESPEDIRRRAAIAYMRGLRVAEDSGVSYGPLPELPSSMRVHGSGPEYERLRKEAEQRNIAIRARKEFEKALTQRGVLERHLLYLYGLKPRDREGFVALCDQYLEDKESIVTTLEKLDRVVAEVDGKTLSDESILNPWVPNHVRGESMLLPEERLLKNARVSPLRQDPYEEAEWKRSLYRMKENQQPD